LKNISTGFGLCFLGLGIAAWPVLNRLMPTANASAVTAAAAVTTAATGQSAPTIVWYQAFSSPGTSSRVALIRAWSNGRIEGKSGYLGCSSSGLSWNDENSSCSNWAVISDPAQGLTYRSDINFDEKVDGADLGQLLADWGNAPRQDIPPSDCPLALINP
jgi:hypothetical protein